VEAAAAQPPIRWIGGWDYLIVGNE